MMNFRINGNPVPATIFAATFLVFALWALIGAVLGAGIGYLAGQPLWLCAIIGQILWEVAVALNRTNW